MDIDLSYCNTSYTKLAQAGLASYLDGVVRACLEMPCHYFPDKSLNQKGKSVLQSVLNEHLRQVLAAQGWQGEVIAFRPPHACNGVDRCDFGLVSNGFRLLGEAEFGNGGGLERDLQKFENAHAWGQMDLAFLVCPVSALAKKIDSGVATYEDAKDTISRWHPSKFQQPLVIIGLGEDADNTVNWKESGYTDPSQLSATYGKKEELFEAVRRYLAGQPLPSIGPSVLPSEQLVAKQQSRRMSKPKDLASNEQGQGQAALFL